MNYRDADDEYFEAVKGAESLWPTAQSTQFPQTYRAMFGFCAKTNALKTSMFDMIDVNNPYVFKLIFRCFCEHYLKFMYLFVRFLKERSDAVGAEYFQDRGAAELRDYAKALVAAEGLLGNQASVDLAESIRTRYPAAASKTERELDTLAGQFRSRTILRYIAKEAPVLISGGAPFLSNIVPQYAVLSSFVHGGPHTDRDMHTYADPRTLEECREDARLVFMMAASILMFTGMAVSREFPEQGVVATSVKAVMDRFHAARNEPTTDDAIADREPTNYDDDDIFA